MAVIGVDLGGTNVRAQAIAEDGRPVGELVIRPSNAQSGTQPIIDSLAGAICEARDSAQAPAKAVGMAIPGHIDDEAGMVRWAPNFGETREGVFYQWLDVPLKESLSASVDLPMVMLNDANAAAMGEYAYGSGKGEASCLVMLTLGTGVGGGIVMSPRSVVGSASSPLVVVGGNQGGAELGHILIRQGGLDCNAGSYGALEAYCQRDAIINRAIHRIRRGRESLVWEMTEHDLSKITPKLLSEAADQGDAMAIDIWREVGVALGAGIGSLINVFAPDVFAIGGQIAKAGNCLLDPAMTEARYIAVPSLFKACRIVQAERIADAGILGAAAAAWQRLNHG